MNKSEKIAIFMITTIILSNALSIFAYFDPAFNFGFGPPATGVVICVLVALAVAGTFYRNIWISTYQILKKTKTKIDLDERDYRILQIAEYAGFCISYVFFAVACLVCWLFISKDGTISSGVFPVIGGGGYGTYELARSITVLVQYGRGGRNE